MKNERLKKYPRLWVFFVLLLFLNSSLEAAELRVAVASNFKSTLQKLVADFQLKTGHEVIISSASSGKLYAQIIHGAPYDVFLSADEKRVNLLMTENKADSSTAYVYALGKLVLLSNIIDANGCQSVLQSNRLKRFAIANPDIAPYGLAARQVLQKLNLWSHLQERLVMGENIAQTLLFVSTKNVQAGFVAKSMLVMSNVNMAKLIENACIWNVPQELYSPVKQKMILLNTAKEKVSAQAFMKYIRSLRAKEIIKSSGYDVQ